MKAIHALVLAAAVLLAGCSAERRVTPSPAPSSTPVPRPPRPAPAPAIDWRQASVTAGDWTWSGEGGQSVARFAGGALVLRCDRTAGTIQLARAGIATQPVPMTIYTSALTRPLAGIPQGTPPALVASIPARDPLLDAMAFSRGRFAVEAAGLPTLVIPSWPEVSRVVEDCR